MYMTYSQRVPKHTNKTAKRLLELMDRKCTNLCVSVDVTKKESLLAIVEAVGAYVCLIKTHIDIVEDFDSDLVTRLQRLSQVHDFLIFEDRKFADIGNTVSLQYSRGVHKIASWADITNAHAIPGPGVISGLASIGLPLGRGLLLLAEMSSKGNLATGSYTQDAIQMARDNRDFVIGFIAMSRETLDGSAAYPSSEEDFLILTPGVGLDDHGDGTGQQYRSPREVILQHGCDVIIVGRGIYGKGDAVDIDSVRRQADRYRAAGWDAYLDRIQQVS